MNDDTMREYLAGWLMEFGSGWVGWERQGSDWYIHVCQRTHTVVDYCSRGYFDVRGPKYKINQKGLDFIKGEQRD